MVYYFGCKFGILGETDGASAPFDNLNCVAHGLIYWYLEY